MESVPKAPEPEQKNYTHPLKSVMRNSAGVKAKGGVALHYHMQDLCKNHQIEDERPISPAKHKYYEREVNDTRDRDARKEMNLPKRQRTDDSPHRSSSPLKSQNKSIKDLIKRDKQIALQRRQKLDSARSKNGPSEQMKRSMATMSYAERPKSSGHTRIKQRSMTSTKISRPKSPARTSCLKNKNRQDDTVVFDRTFERETRANFDPKSPEETRERRYYKQEDLRDDSFYRKDTRERLHVALGGGSPKRQSPQRDDLQQSSSPVKAEKHHENVSSESKYRISARYEAINRDRPGIAKHANSVIDRHHHRQKQYGLSMPSSQLYPYSSESK